MVRSAIAGNVLDQYQASRSGAPVLSVVGSFIEIWSSKYFDIGDDRKVAGFVPDYLMGNSKIDLEDLKPRGYDLLKFAAERDLEDFRFSTPGTFACLVDHDMLSGSGKNPKQT